jgi:type II secretion system protein I
MRVPPSRNLTPPAPLPEAGRGEQAAVGSQVAARSLLPLPASERGRGRGSARDGMTLLEVLLALAIFLFSLVAISQLFNTATDQATEIQYQSRATRLAESRLQEYVAGVRSLQAGGSGTFDEEPEWEWKADCQSDGTAQNLYNVTVTVSRTLADGRHIEASLSQYILDPKMKGAITASNASASSSSPSSGGAPGSSGQQPNTAGQNSSGGSSSTGGNSGGNTSGSGSGSRPGGGGGGGGGMGGGGGGGGGMGGGTSGGTGGTGGTMGGR